VVTGPSGSGKSSLAFDTLYAEGQRRYVESMSIYARQFLERMPRPDVDHVDGVPPAIAIGQRNGSRNARSTVGTVTEVSDYLRLLFARVGEVRCSVCGGSVVRDSATAAADLVIRKSGRVVVIAPVPVGAALAATLPELVRGGHRRLWMQGKVVDAEALSGLLEGPEGPELPSVRWLAEARVIPVLIDRFPKLSVGDRGRLVEALEAAFRLSGGRAEVFVDDDVPLRFDEGFSCSRCQAALRPPVPGLFSFNSPLGACDACQGFGRVIGLDLGKVIPDGRKTLLGGAVAPFQTPSNLECQDDLVKHAAGKAPLDVPWNQLSDSAKKWIVDGDPAYTAGGWKRGQWYGIRGFFRYLESKKYKMHVRVMLARYRGYDPCEVCGGTRLRAEARSVFVGGRTFPELEATPIAALRAEIASWSVSWSVQARATALPIVRELASRLEYLDTVGLGYLTLGRQARTLSGGEAQRIALASALGAQLTGTLYVLDEPSIGLHPRDSARLVSVLERLVERDNTVVVVEHDPEIIAAADQVIDLGPHAGAAGGEVVFAGSFADMMTSVRSPTGAFLRARRSTTLPSLSGEEKWLRVFGARGHNLRGVDVSFPMERLSCLTGVSGSGKSSLLVDVLYARAQRERGEAVDGNGTCDGVEGLGDFVAVELVDQSAPARSSRSNPATYLKAMDELRQRFAACPEAEQLGLAAGAFSFNVPGGRCEVCQGQGTVTLEMHFLADVTVECDVCGGRRFSEKVLGVRWRGLTILDCLALTVDEAVRRFADDKKLVSRLQPFVEVGLGYLTLGQSTSTLSGGESQRLKLAAHLHAKAGPTLLLLDEPTTGLHGSDVAVLLAALRRLVAAGHTVVAIEHNLDFLAACDWLVDLGPDGGDGGGQVVATGTPMELAVAETYTGAALRAAFG